MFITAFGETKSMSDWIVDSRCNLENTKSRRQIIWDRLKNQNMPTEWAIMLPRRPMHLRNKPVWNLLKITAFGEIKNSTEWLLDSRCNVDNTIILVKRINLYKWPTEWALILPPMDHKTCINIGIEKNKLKQSEIDKRLKQIKSCEGCGCVLPVWILNPEKPKNRRKSTTSDFKYSPMRFNRSSRCRFCAVWGKKQSKVKITAHQITAFGETKTYQEWAMDTRCLVNKKGIWHRINKLGWDPEMAITLPRTSKGRQTKSNLTARRILDEVTNQIRSIIT
jgi:hypothetical protein